MSMLNPSASTIVSAWLRLFIHLSSSHSPNFSGVNWDMEKVKEAIQNWPVDTPINWSKIGRENEVPGKNAGQVVKEFAD